MPTSDLTQLTDREWSTAELVAGAGITYDAFTNYLRSPLALVSKSSGRGKARTYPLIDVYQVALLARLSKLTGKLAWSAGALNHAILIEAEIRALVGRGTLLAPENADERPTAEIHAERLAALGRSIFSAPPAYSWRDLGAPYFIFAQEDDILTDRQVVEAGRKNDFGVLDAMDSGGVYLNMTSTLWGVDRRLQEIVDGK